MAEEVKNENDLGVWSRKLCAAVINNLKLDGLPTGTTDVVEGNRTWLTIATNSELRAEREGRRTLRHVLDTVFSEVLTMRTDEDFYKSLTNLGVVLMSMGLVVEARKNDSKKPIEETS